MIGEAKIGGGGQRVTIRERGKRKNGIRMKMAIIYE